jgi:hypothetical protein
LLLMVRCSTWPAACIFKTPSSMHSLNNKQPHEQCKGRCGTQTICKQQSCRIDAMCPLR